MSESNSLSATPAVINPPQADSFVEDVASADANGSLGTYLSLTPEPPQEGQRHTWFKVRLPSFGIHYGGKVREGYVRIRKLLVQEEQILQSNSDLASRIATIISNGLQTDMPSSQLLLTDRLAALVLQRSLTFGGDYSFVFKCPSCKVDSKITTNLLKNLKYRGPDDVVDEALERGDTAFTHCEPFPVVLTDAGTVAHCRFLRGFDEEAILRRVKELAAVMNNAQTDPTHVVTMSRRIVSIDNVPEWKTMSPIKREVWLQSLTSADSRRIANAVERRETGLITKLSVTCRVCGNSQAMHMPIDAEFFQPTAL
jgi:hypothetical protein